MAGAVSVCFLLLLGSYICFVSLSSISFHILGRFLHFCLNEGHCLQTKVYPIALLDELGGGVPQGLHSGAGHLLHPLGQGELGVFRVQQVGEQRTVLAEALVLK